MCPLLPVLVEGCRVLVVEMVRCGEAVGNFSWGGSSIATTATGYRRIRGCGQGVWPGLLLLCLCLHEISKTLLGDIPWIKPCEGDQANFKAKTTKFYA